MHNSVHELAGHSSKGLDNRPCSLLGQFTGLQTAIYQYTSKHIRQVSTHSSTVHLERITYLTHMIYLVSLLVVMYKLNLVCKISKTPQMSSAGFSGTVDKNMKRLSILLIKRVKQCGSSIIQREKATIRRIQGYNFYLICVLRQTR